MAEQPETVLARLNPRGRTDLVVKLQELDNKATAAQTEADLKEVAETVYRLVEDEPALSALFRQEGRISIVDYPAHKFPERSDLHRHTTHIHQRLERLRTRSQAAGPSSATRYDLDQIFETIRQKGYTSAEGESGFGDKPGIHNSVRNYTQELTQIQRSFSFR